VFYRFQLCPVRHSSRQQPGRTISQALVSTGGVMLILLIVVPILLFGGGGGYYGRGAGWRGPHTVADCWVWC
jgi:hypothetical protein